MKRAVALLERKRVLVTGGASGIGRAIAIKLAEEGAHVAVADIQLPQATVQAITSKGGHAVAIKADISKPEQVSEMVDEAVHRMGALDGLVNNAGIFSSLTPTPFEQIDLAHWQAVFEVNVFGLMSCCQAVVPHMRTQGHGRIVNIISGTVFKGVPYMLHYVASKGAVLAMTRSLARELGPAGIRVNGVAPGFTLSESVRANPTQMGAQVEVNRNSRALARDQQPEDVVGAVAYFLSDGADFVTGQTLVVDGGSHFN